MSMLGAGVGQSA